MKQLIILFFIMGLKTISYAQKQGDIYAFRFDDIEMKRWDPGAKKELIIADQTDHSTKWLKFQLRWKEGKEWIYKILRSKSGITDPKIETGDQHPKKLHYVDKEDNDAYFHVNEEELEKIAVTGFVEPRLFALDGFVVPIKLRFSNKQGGDFDLTQSINLGTVLNLNLDRWGMLDNKSAAFIIGFNLTNVSVDEKTVPGVYTTKAQALAISPVAGFKLKYDKIEFGLISGLDVLTGQARRSWVYRKSPWLGITLGTSLAAISGGKIEN